MNRSDLVNELAELPKHCDPASNQMRLLRINGRIGRHQARGREGVYDEVIKMARRLGIAESEIKNPAIVE